MSRALELASLLDTALAELVSRMLGDDGMATLASFPLPGSDEAPDVRVAKAIQLLRQAHVRANEDRWLDAMGLAVSALYYADSAQDDLPLQAHVCSSTITILECMRGRGLLSMETVDRAAAVAIEVSVMANEPSHSALPLMTRARIASSRGEGRLAVGYAEQAVSASEGELKDEALRIRDNLLIVHINESVPPPAAPTQTTDSSEPPPSAGPTTSPAMTPGALFRERPAVTMAPEMSQLVVTLRDPGFLLGVNSIDVLVDGQHMASMRLGETVTFDVMPGEHTVVTLMRAVVTRSSNELRIAARNGNTTQVVGTYSRAWGTIKLTEGTGRGPTRPSSAQRQTAESIDRQDTRRGCLAMFAGGLLLVLCSCGYLWDFVGF